MIVCVTMDNLTGGGCNVAWFGRSAHHFRTGPFLVCRVWPNSDIQRWETSSGSIIMCCRIFLIVDFDYDQRLPVLRRTHNSSARPECASYYHMQLYSETL